MNDKEWKDILEDIMSAFSRKQLKKVIEQVEKQARQEGKLEGIAEEKKRSIKLVDVNEELNEVRQGGIMEVTKIILEIKDKSKGASKLADSQEEQLAYSEWISCCNEILNNIKELKSQNEK